MIAYSDHDKDLLLNNTARVYSRLTFTRDGEIVFVATEDDNLQEWDYEDYRYVPENGFIGQFVERLLDGKLLNLPSAIDINGCEVKMEIGIKDPDEDTVNYYNYGHFLITKVSDTDTNGTVSFESSDYAKKFNKKYEDRMNYPCTAGELLEDVCDQAGVNCESPYGNVNQYMFVPDEEYPAGAYSLKVGEFYYNFTSTRVLKPLELFYLRADYTRYLTHQYIDDDDTVKTISYRATYSASATGTVLEARTITADLFRNGNFVIENNQFEENTSLRDVVKYIAMLGFSWARITNSDVLHLDFAKKSFDNVNKYTTINTDTYYTSTVTGNKFGPVDEVLIGMSNIEGENITIHSGNRVLTAENSRKVSPEQDSEHDSILLDSAPDSATSIALYDNPLTYTEQLRRIAMSTYGDYLLGLEYTPVTSETIGYPWLDGDDYVKVENVDGETYYTYPFNRRISYKGYLESSIESIAKSLTQTEYKYEGDVDRRIRHTEIIVDKHEGEIRAVAEQVDTVENNITELNSQYSDVLSQIDTTNINITQLSSRVDSVQTSTYTKTEIQQIARGEGPDGVAVSVVSTMAGQFDINGMHYAKSGAPTQSTINQFGVEVNESNEDGTSGASLLYAGYDYDTTSPTNGESVVKVANINISDWTNIGLHGRFQDYTDEDDNEGIGFFLV